jgi:hypothetical protein
LIPGRRAGAAPEDGTSSHPYVDGDAWRLDRGRSWVVSQKINQRLRDVPLGLGPREETDHEAGNNQHSNHAEENLLQPDAAAFALAEGARFLTCHEQLLGHDIMRAFACLAGSCAFQ